MHVPRFTPALVAAVTFTVALGCARGQSHPGGEPAPAPAPTAPEAQVKTSPPAAPAAVRAAPTPAELHAEFDAQQRRIDVAVRTLEHEHYVYATERSWGARVVSQWAAWGKKKERAAIHDLIKIVADASERQVEIARALRNPDLAVRAEVERTRAEQLLGSLDDYNAHDHNTHE